MPPRHKPWIKVDADTDESAKIGSLPNHSARWAWFRMMCRAKTQRHMGLFGSVQHLKQLLGIEGKYVPDLLTAGLLHTWPVTARACDRCARDYAGDAQPGNLVVHDFRREQRDPTAADRQAAARESRTVELDSHADSHGSVTDDSRALSPSLSMSSSEPNPRDVYQVGDDGSEFPVLSWLAGQGVAINPNGNGFHRRVVVLVGRYGPERVRGAMADAMAQGAQGDRAIVFGAENILDKPPTGKADPKPKGSVQSVASIREQLDAR